MSIRLALVDSNSRYIEKLAAWIHKNMPYQFSIEILTNSESFQKWTEKGGQADLVVVSIDMVNNVLSGFPKEGVLVLDDGTHKPINQDVPRVDKYRPAEELAKDILSLCADRMPRMHAREKHMQSITLVIYLDGSNAVNPVAPAIAHFFSARDRKTLYFSLEEAQTTSLYFNGISTRGLNEMLYFIKSNRDNLFMRLEACLTKDPASGVHFLSEPAGLLSPQSIDTADINSLLSATDSEGDFDEIVIAAELGMFDLIRELMGKADRILTVAINTASSSLKMERFFQELEKGNSDMGTLKEKLRLILINIGPYDGFNGRFTDFHRYMLKPHPVETVSGWVPSENDFSVFAAILGDYEKAGYHHE
ncbi:MAG: hypothetical protein GX384_03685 [Clostridiaceae bacterium]|jgi:cellulose biosynthesis protein BcsQ|nr:hypothetical protein [Bacillota bacterium]NLI38431.1 hypothetical protein [Clostridiaceae bacterium]